MNWVEIIICSYKNKKIYILVKIVNSLGFFEGTRPLSKAFFVQCKLYRYIGLILKKTVEV